MPARLLNVGCGTTVHPDWVNVDFAPSLPGVLALDVRQPLPFGDASFDAAYCSHVLEHLPRTEGPLVLERLRRVLRPGAVLRVAVPDLEAMAREYLAILDALERGEDRARDHEWIVLEMYDQFARTESGGDMAGYLAAHGRTAFVRRRSGEQARQPGKFSLPEALRGVRRRLAGWAAWVVGGGAAREALREGYFRRSGEVHRWMYDASSLRRALEAAGFVEARRCTAHESAIADFARYRLDVDERGEVRKPDSLFMEARVR